MNWISEQQGEQTRQVIMQMIRDAADRGVPIHRAVIARSLNVTRSTAGKHVDRLMRENKVREINGRMLELLP